MAKEKPSPFPNLIECADHQLAPWHVICVHLLRGRPAAEWVQVVLAEDDRREIDGDWICRACLRFVDQRGSHPDCLALANRLRPACLHCVNSLKARAGFVRDEAGVLVRP